MTRMTPLLERNEQFARTYTPTPFGLPAARVLVVTCLDHRVDPAIVLGLRLGDAPVIRNAGGRVTPAVIDDLAYLAFLAGELSGGQDARDTLFEVAVVHHTHHPGRLPKHDRVRAAGPGQLQPGGDQSVPHGTPRPSPPLRLGYLCLRYLRLRCLRLRCLRHWPPVRASSSPAATSPSRTAPRGRRGRAAWLFSVAEGLAVTATA